MIMRSVLLVAAASLLAACGGGGSEQTVDFSGREKGHVFYTYPADEQAGVSVHAPLVVQFSEPPGLAESDVTLNGPQGAVNVAVSWADGGSSLVVTPSAPLAFNSEYTLALAGMTLEGVGGGALNFVTGSAKRGAVEAQQQAADFVVSRFSPAENRPLMDFSTLRLQFSQPLDATTVDYGSSVTLTDNADNVIPVSVLSGGNRLTIDPVEDLTPGNTYTLTLTSDLASVFGNSLTGGASYSLVPEDSAPSETLVLEAMAADPVKGCNEDGVTRSPLTGAPINCVPLVAKLLGDTTVSKLSGNVFADLAYIPNYPDAAPLRISKGSLLEGEPLDVLIGGYLPAGFDSGDVTVSFVSDANGYLLPTPYSQSPEAPRRVELTLDLAFSTADSRANGAFTQSLLQVDLVGRAIVEEGRMVIDAVGVVEPEVLGIETAYGVLSFHMESYADQENAPQPVADISGPVLQSWQPGDFADRFRPGDPIILNLNETPDQTTIEPGVTLMLTQQGSAVPFQWQVDGASVVLMPDQPLSFGTEYQVALTDGVQDLRGNPASPETVTFSMPSFSTNAPRSPNATTVYPGYPCAVDPASRDLAAGEQGQCVSNTQGQAGDVLPLPTLPANRAIAIQFSQDMDTSSMVLGTSCDDGSVRVEKIDAAGNCLEVVPATLSPQLRELTIIPQAPWEQGQLYRYVLGSHSATGCGQNVICSSAGMPLQTAQLLAPESDVGGPDLSVAFVGAEATDNVFLPLRNLPKTDVNANFLVDSEETATVEVPAGSGVYPVPANAARLGVTGYGGAVTGANVGCGFTLLLQPLSCPDQKDTYLNGGINVDIVGWDEAEQAVEVTLYPPVLYTTSKDVHAQLVGVPTSVPTGPLVMRARYRDDGTGRRTLPLQGWIRYDEVEDQLTFDTALDLLLDAQEMEPLGLPLPHNLYSYPLDDVQLKGPVDFLPDGRMVIGLESLTAKDIDVNIGSGLATIDLAIPVGGVNLTFQSGSIK
ncbi:MULTISPECIES: Ig-like domain-containing protein [Alcanivorax]|nr:MULTISPECIES: Ig-like domain-containing protein [Alcanivorax]